MSQVPALPPGALAVTEYPPNPWRAPGGAVVLAPGGPTWQPEAQSLVPGFFIHAASTDAAHRLVALGGGCRLQLFDRTAGRIETEFYLTKDVDEVLVAPDAGAVAFSVAELGLVLWERGQGFLRLEQAALEYVSSMQFSGDGQRLVVADSDQRVGVWNRATGQCLWRGELGSGMWPYQVLTDPKWDGALVAAEFMLSGVQLWSVPLDGSAPVERSAVSRIDPDSTRSTLFVAAGTDADGLPRAEALSAQSHAVAQDLDRRFRVEARREPAGPVVLGRTDSREGAADEVRLDGAGESLENSTGLGVASDGEVFYADERRVRFLAQLAPATDPVDQVCALLLDPTRDRLWCAGLGGIRYRDLAGEPEPAWLPATSRGGVHSLGLDPAGRVLCLGDGELSSITDPAFTPLVPGFLRALSEDCAWVASAAGATLEVGPIGETRGRLPVDVLSPRQDCLRFLPGGHDLLGVGEQGCWLWRDGEGPGWSALSSEPARSILAMAATEQRVALATNEGLRLVSLDDSEPARKLDLPAAIAAAFLADGRLVVATLDRSLHLFDARLGVVTKSWRAGAEPVTCLAVDAEGTTLYSGASDGAVVAWELARWAPRA